MKATNTPFNTSELSESVERIDTILDAGGGAFEVRKSVPSADELTFENGFYVDCTALFIDIRDSSRLTSIHTRPVLAKLYRAYISEAIAVINSNAACREVIINGDCVSGIFNTPYKSDINGVFETAAMLNSMMAVLNWKFENKGYTPIKCGIGMDYGTALMVKAGYKGVAINEIAWMGDVVNKASNLCGMGNKGERMALQLSPSVHLNLTDQYKALLRPIYDLQWRLAHYESSAVNVAMSKWLEQEQSSARIRRLFDMLSPPKPQPEPLTMGGLLSLGLAAPRPAELSLRDLAYPRLGLSSLFWPK